MSKILLVDADNLDLVSPQAGTDHAAHTTEVATSRSTGLGRRNATSGTGADESAASPECAISDPVDLAPDVNATVWPGPAKLLGIWVEVAIGTEVFTLMDGATTRMTVPLLGIGVHPLPGVIFETSLIINPGATTTGTVRLLFRPLDPLVGWAY